MKKKTHWVFVIALVAILVVSIVMVNRRTIEGFFKTSTQLKRNPVWLTTHYSDTGNGSSNIPFDIYPIKWKGKNVFPAAVHERDNQYLYHVLSVTFPDGGKGFVHVMDFCNRCHSDCKGTVEIGGNRYSKPNYLLLDIHEKAFGGKGIKGSPRNVYNPKVKSVGVLRPQNMKSKLPKDGRYFIDGTKRCKRGAIRDANCDNKKSAEFFGDYCAWKPV